ncbi:zinc-finger domain-containing protein [Rhodobacter sp. TJ_12]|uniref:zinc-finger domain-containing protein n=1 Tax=Rhodobacter sp. TJ_12 TaxID=2029399 RepID=UPI001CBAEC9A|nr:zinc-finger domain-containing protein [Rhodobacter sp. TJ_12]MBZ4021320.1 zinc-finger domain-containing protein [Rhodobacter sp. TJ_12]
MTKTPETQTVTSWKVACDGGEGGHPRVWLTIPHDEGQVVCPYCGKTFVIDREHAHDGH